MSRDQWWRGVPTLRLEIDCCGASHELVWRRGAIGLPHHDVAAERTMIALGADKPQCLAIVDAWRAGLEQPDAILASQSAAESIGVALAQRLVALQRLSKQRIAAGPPTPRPANRSLPGELAHRLVSAATVGYLRRSPEAVDGELVRRMLQARVEAAVRAGVASWRRRAAGRQISVVVERRDDGAPAGFDGRIEHGSGEICVAVPVSWLLEVQARGLAVVDGTFVLRILGSSPGHCEALGVRWASEAGGRRIVPVTGRVRLVQFGRVWRSFWIDL